MNNEITAYIKNRLSESDFRKIDFDEAVDKFYYYSDHPVSVLPISEDDRVTYIINYYQCESDQNRTIYIEKKLRIDFYIDKYQIVDFEKLKSEVKILFSNIIGSTYFTKMMYSKTAKDLKSLHLKKELGFD